MKRSIAIILCIVCGCSVFSIEDEKFKENLENSRHLTELMMDEEYVKRQKALAEERRLKKEAETELYDGFLDIKYHLETYYSFSSEFLRVELFGKTGTFNVYYVPKNGMDVPLFSSVDLFSSTSFFLNVDEQVYRLNKSNLVRRELRRLQNGAQLVYTTDDDARLIVDFSLAASRAENPEDIIQIKLYVINMGTVRHEVDLKGIFDTVCGEVSSVHFTTNRGTKIRNELCFSREELEKERSVVSSNGIVSFQFVLDGAEIPPVESVSFANVDELYRMDWNARIRKGRGFTNNRAYDNSAVMIDWPSEVLSPNGKSEKVFFIAVAANEYPRGLYYVDGIPSAAVSDSGVGFSDPLKTKTEKANPQKTQETPVPPKASKNQDKRTDVEFIVPPIKDYQLDPEYIQGLIDRIDALQSSKDINQKELRKLNAELDAILEKLRRQ